MKNFLKLVAVVSSIVLSSSLFADTSDTNISPRIPATTEPMTQSNTTLATTSASDSMLIQNVQAKIAQENSLKGFNINVTSQDGIVTLSGTVNSQQQVDTAIDAAMSIDGVADVKSNLIIKHTS